MKMMTCKQLGGACDLEFRASNFEEIAELSKKHGIEMYQKNDAQHVQAMKKMQSLMKDPEAMQLWFKSKKAEFEAFPDGN
ncbi:DUF1059 domain-containing protein [Microbulbifer sp. OS29]|uniref:DUF1059 domain-containing protein n=1 Tax=Microbulbifer okhotskensis TaxID=2926617 RepID=A0A9X2J3V6_9GAMM|nr:DUF1059 domain-containing protein [Microbulbifer okhotskensis]MCO1333897.1 DUF1059 domain-containing protein [Microbulbifer okhotskensis]